MQNWKISQTHFNLSLFCWKRRVLFFGVLNWKTEWHTIRLNVMGLHYEFSKHAQIVLFKHPELEQRSHGTPFVSPAISLVLVQTAALKSLWSIYIRAGSRPRRDPLYGCKRRQSHLNLAIWTCLLNLTVYICLQLLEISNWRFHCYGVLAEILAQTKKCWTKEV